MPELPEVQTIVNGLNRMIINKEIEEISWDWAKSFPNSKESLEATLGTKVIKAHRRGKAVLIDLKNKTTLLIHLKMTGQLVYQSNNSNGSFPDKSTRVQVHFKDGSTLFFNDTRKFGWMKIMTPSELEENSFLKKLGPEPLKRNFTKALFQEQMSRRKNTFVKAALLDQTVLAGIGNIYCDEALFLAGIMPDRRVHTLTEEDYKKLHRTLRKVLNTSIELGGSTRRDYLNAEGTRGHYLDQAWVYARQGEACRKCGAIIHKIRVAGRGTHFCPQCQT